jgi:hypothetical protein
LEALASPDIIVRLEPASIYVIPAQMPIYDFHIPDLNLHTCGLELPNADAARRHAEQLAEGIATVARSLNASAETFVEAVDETGTTVVRCIAHRPC